MDTIAEVRTGIGEGRAVSLSEIDRLKAKSFEFFSKIPFGEIGWEETEFWPKIDYDEDRGERRDRKGYVDLLPMVNGKNVEQIIDELKGKITDRT